MKRGFVKAAAKFESGSCGGDGFVRLAIHTQGVGEIAVQIREIGAKLDSPAIGGDRMIGLVRVFQSRAEIVVSNGVVRLKRDHRAEDLQRCFSVAGAASNGAKESEGVGVIGVLSEDLADKVFGFGELAGAIKIDG